MARSGIAILLLLLCGGAATGFYLVRRNDQPPTNTGPPSVRAERRMIGNAVNATGTIRLAVGSEVRVGSQLSGIVKTLNVTVGSHVNAGDVIAEIDDTLIQAQLAQADAQVELDRATMERANMNAERARQLGSQGLIPIQQQQDLQLASHETRAKYEKSLRDRDLVKVDLGRVQIRAPISGTVASVSTQKGETVAASFAAPTFVTIIGDNSLQLVAMVDETDIANVARGNQVSFTVDSYPAHSFPGKVESVAPKATIVSGVVNYEVTIQITKDTKMLKPDMTASVSIETAQHQALVLPSSALHHDGQETFVYVAARNQVERRPVAVGPSDGGLTEIRRGISAADKILLLQEERDK